MTATASAVVHVTARAAVPAAPAAVQREAVRLSVETVLAVTAALVGLLRLRLSAAGDERWQAGIAAAFGTRLRRMLLRAAPAIGLWLLTRRIRRLLLIRLSLARLIGLRLTPAVGHVAHRLSGPVVVAPVVTVVATLLAAGGVVTVVRIVLPELFLRRGDQAEIMFGVLKVIFRRHRVARGLGVACQLHVFIGDVVGGPADLHVGTV